jgi:hypothetical protein
MGLRQVGDLLGRVFGVQGQADARGPTLIVGLFVAYCSYAYALSSAYSFQIEYDLYNRVSFVSVSLFVLVFLLRMLFCLITERPKYPINHLKQKISIDWELKEKFFYGVPYFAILTIFFSFYSSLKSAIATVRPYYFDVYAADLDATLHGVDPWRLLHAILGGVTPTWAVSVVYALWVLVIYGTVAFALFFLNDRRLRDRFVASMLVSWSLLGTIAATMFSSVGPCYFQVFYGDDRYAALMARLDAIDAAIPLPSRFTQNYLIETYQAAIPGLGTGISAFPSLHVASAMLVCLLAWNFNRFWKTAGILFVTTVLIGSVHLGWHYAVDGYASIFAVLLIWHLVGRALGNG